MNRSGQKLTGILLAGGLSRRMGREKGLLRVGCQYLYQYPLQVLEACCDEILISSCKEAVLPEHYPTVCDQIPGIGPMGGIYTCLNRSSNDLNVVLSYDLPLVSKELIDFLMTRMEGYEAVVPFLDEGQPEPLCAVYRKNCRHLFRELIDQKEYAVHKVFAKTRTNFVLIGPALSFYRPEMFTNINREEDLGRLPGHNSSAEYEG